MMNDCLLLLIAILLRCVHSLEDTKVCVDGVCGVGGTSSTLDRKRERRRARDDVSQGELPNIISRGLSNTLGKHTRLAVRMMPLRHFHSYDSGKRMVNHPAPN
jgi:hypothetical protein